jgi:4a-hydroxytetrahydrobiopterin dehydratase
MKLTHTELQAAMSSLPNWTCREDRGGIIQREFVFTDFVQAIGFMNRAAFYAEEHNHHPEWSNVYNRVTVLLTTHDVNGISMNDIAMAKFMDHIACVKAVDCV